MEFDGGKKKKKKVKRCADSVRAMRALTYTLTLLKQTLYYLRSSTFSHRFLCKTRTGLTDTNVHMCASAAHTHFSPAVGVWCAKRDAPTQKCQRGRELGKGGLINGALLSMATPLCEALWLHIALLPNEAQLLEENDGFALELQGIMATVSSASLISFSPLSLSLILAPAYSQHSSTCSLFCIPCCPLSSSACVALGS